MNPFFDSLARQMLLRQGYTPEQIAQQLKAVKAQAPTQGNLFNLFQQDPVQTRTPAGQLKPKPVRPPVKGQMPLFKTPPARGPLTIPKYETPATNPFLETPKNTGRVGVKPVPGQGGLKGFGRQVLRSILSIPAVTANLAFSDYGQSGENPDARARRLGYASLEQQQMAQMLFQQGVPAKDIKAALKEDKVQTTAQQVSQAQIEGLTMPGGMFYMGGNGKRPLSSGTKTPPQPAVVTEAPPQMQYVPPTPQRKAPKPKPAKPMEQAYGASGKDLYMAHKKNNPLMIRYFGKNYGSSKES